MDDAVDDGAGDCRYADHIVPMIHQNLAGDDEGADVVAVFDDRQQIARLVADERLRSSCRRSISPRHTRLAPENYVSLAPFAPEPSDDRSRQIYAVTAVATPGILQIVPLLATREPVPAPVDSPTLQASVAYAHAPAPTAAAEGSVATV